MRVVYTPLAAVLVDAHVGYTFQMRVVYTRLRVFSLYAIVGYTFQMRVVYTEKMLIFTTRAGWIYLSNEGGIHLVVETVVLPFGWIYLSNEGGIHLFVGIQLSHLYLRYLPSE